MPVITCAADYMFHPEIGSLRCFYDNWVARRHQRYRSRERSIRKRSFTTDRHRIGFLRHLPISGPIMLERK